MFSMGGQKATKDEQSKTDPWGPAQPALKGVLDDLEKLRTSGDTGAMPGAIDDAINWLKTSGATGGEGYTKAGGMLLDTPDRTGDITSAYGALNNRLAPVADGTNQDLSGNTYLQSLLKQVGDDAQKRVNSQFAAAGRDFSGANNIEVGKGVTQAQLPLLLDQYNREVGRSDAAARDLYSTGASGAVAQTGMDVSRGGLLAKGAELTKAGVDAGTANAEALLGLAEAKDKLPLTKLGWLAELLYPAAGLGSEKTGSATQNGSNWGFGAKLY